MLISIGFIRALKERAEAFRQCINSYTVQWDRLMGGDVILTRCIWSIGLAVTRVPPDKALGRYERPRRYLTCAKLETAQMLQADESPRDCW